MNNIFKSQNSYAVNITQLKNQFHQNVLMQAQAGMESQRWILDIEGVTDDANTLDISPHSAPLLAYQECCFRAEDDTLGAAKESGGPVAPPFIMFGMQGCGPALILTTSFYNKNEYTAVKFNRINQSDSTTIASYNIIYKGFFITEIIESAVGNSWCYTFYARATEVNKILEPKKPASDTAGGKIPIGYNFSQGIIVTPE